MLIYMLVFVLNHEYSETKTCLCCFVHESSVNLMGRAVWCKDTGDCIHTASQISWTEEFYHEYRIHVDKAMPKVYQFQLPIHEVLSIMACIIMCIMVIEFMWFNRRYLNRNLISKFCIIKMSVREIIVTLTFAWELFNMYFMVLDLLVQNVISVLLI